MMMAVAYAQPSRADLKKHRLIVQESKNKGTAVVSLDTLFCSGKAQAYVTQDTNMVGHLFRSIQNNEPLIRVNYRKDVSKTASDMVLAYRMEFPGIGLSCEVKPTGSVQDMICRHGLLNNQALDTLKAETFIVLKGIKNENREKPAQPEHVLVGRNKKAPLVFSTVNNAVGARDIQQDGLTIGAFKADSTEGPGGMLSRYVVYNSEGAIICNATQTKNGSQDWHLLIDNKSFRSLKVTPGKDLDDIVTYLINSGLL